MIGNLTENAAKWSRSQLHITARALPPAASKEGAKKGQAEALAEILILIEDDGPGIPPEVSARLFEPFFTTKPSGKGTGLGLALSREFVDHMGGCISVRTAVGKGACFTVKLPRHPPVVAPEPVEVTQPEPLLTGRFDSERTVLRRAR